MKQKVVLIIAIFGLTAGLTSAIFVASLPGSTVYAQETDPCSVATGDITRDACREAVDSGGDPCEAMHRELVNDPKNEGTTLAEDTRKSCQKITICNTTATGPTTRADCELAIDNDTDPCDAMHTTLNNDPQNEGTTLADDTLRDCRGVAGSSGGGIKNCKEGEPDCCGGVRTSIINGDMCSGEGGSLLFGILEWVLGIMTAGVGIAAVGGIGYGALLYTTAENKPEQTKKAISIITNVVIGIAAYALMYLFLNFLIPGGVFG